MERKELTAILEAHRKWLSREEGGKRANLRNADLRFADLRYAVLRGANLRGAILSGADLDYSCWPLWCGSVGVKVDIKIMRQLLAHVYACECDDPEAQRIKDVIRPFAAKSHRARECGVPELGPEFKPTQHEGI